ncbi:response regulator [Paenibacillus aurantiacus]|uniref:Response regulator n=1 Tax=Paenibacillus aurantiacus TaxID=1936118 RepID=A0ABV5KS25_9BACL
MIRLLIVDDEQATRDGLLNYVEWQELGIDIVKTAADGWEALQLSFSYKPDIVLTDVKMPRMDGIQFAIKLRESQPQCKIVFLSSYAEKEYLKSAIQLKALDFLEKPVNLDVIRKELRLAVKACQDERKQRMAEQEIRTENELLQQEQQALYFISRDYEHSDKSNKSESPLSSHQTGYAFATAIIKLMGLSEQELQRFILQKNEIYEHIKIRFSFAGLETLRGFKDSQHLIIHAYAKSLAAPDELINPLALIRSDLQTLFGKPMLTFIGVGQLVHRPERLLDSYHSAAVAIQRQFFKGYNHILVFQEVRRSASLQPARGSSFGPAFAACLEEEKFEKASDILASAVENLKANEDTLVNDAKNVFFDLLQNLFKVAEKKKILLSDPQDDKEYLWNLLYKFNTLQEMVFYAEGKLRQFFTQLRDKPNSGYIAAGIFEFVHANFADPELSIKSIAEHLFLTPNYLSLQFKKETGMTINQYITDFRIDKAKELLSNRQYKLYEIAAHVGIQDANYFAKTFKKVTGLTPSEFKERHT